MTDEQEYRHKTQCDRVLQYIEEFGSITTRDAMNDLGIFRLASRIHDLKTKRGIELKKRMIEVKNRYGDTVSIAEYSKANEQGEIEPWAKAQ